MEKKCFTVQLVANIKSLLSKQYVSVFEEVHESYGNYLEADTRVKFHVNHADKNDNGNVIIRGNDTYVAIILTYNANLLTNSYLLYDFGVDCNNNLEYLDITKFSKCLTYEQALLGIYRKGKTRHLL